MRDMDFSITMMTSSNGNLIRVTGPLCGEFTGDQWIPLTKASDAELWSFLLICARINGWVNNRVVGDFKRHRAHYDATVVIGPPDGPSADTEMTIKLDKFFSMFFAISYLEYFLWSGDIHYDDVTWT